MKHTYTAKAFISGYETVDGFKDGRVIPVLTTGDGSFWTKDGYVEVGEATVTVKLFDGKTVHKKRLDSLHATLEEVRADNQRRENAILDQISKLQALTYEPA